MELSFEGGGEVQEVGRRVVVHPSNLCQATGGFVKRQGALSSDRGLCQATGGFVKRQRGNPADRVGRRHDRDNRHSRPDRLPQRNRNDPIDRPNGAPATPRGPKQRRWQGRHADQESRRTTVNRIEALRWEDDAETDWTDDVDPTTPGGDLLADLERRQDEVLAELDRLEKRVNELLAELKPASAEASVA